MTASAADSRAGQSAEAAGGVEGQIDPALAGEVHLGEHERGDDRVSDRVDGRAVGAVVALGQLVDELRRGRVLAQRQEPVHGVDVVGVLVRLLAEGADDARQRRYVAGAHVEQLGGRDRHGGVLAERGEQIHLAVGPVADVRAVDVQHAERLVVEGQRRRRHRAVALDGREAPPRVGVGAPRVRVAVHVGDRHGAPRLQRPAGLAAALDDEAARQEPLVLGRELVGAGEPQRLRRLDHQDAGRGRPDHPGRGLGDRVERRAEVAALVDGAADLEQGRDLACRDVRVVVHRHVLSALSGDRNH